MPLQPGTTLGPYTVTAKIGEGGMGEVWQARDTTLDRNVALKVLPEAFTSDPDRLARFEREAKVLASLNHPNIGSIYGLEEAEGVRTLVLELVEGPTLADRIKQGPIPLDEALPIAKQIAEALEAAHEQGVIHRDLKPANIKVKDDGTVKVLDFGLAKAFLPDASGPNLSASPTISLTAAATQMGMVIGTAAYMSPEQAKGKTVGKQADVWAFGAVLFEMLSGRRPFTGDDVSETLARVIDREPDWATLPDTVPPILGSFLRRCLQKNPKKRIRDIGDVSLAMEGAFETTVSTPPEPGVVPTLQVWQRPLPAVLAAVALLVLGGLAVSVTRPVGPAGAVARFPVPLPADQTFSFLGRHSVAISPDGSLIAYIAEQSLWLRPIDQLQATQVRGTETEARSPFFSPDGQWIGFYAGGQLNKVSVTGGAPVTLCDATIPYGVSWGTDEMILYGQPDGVWQVPGAGGTPELLIATDPGEQAHGPQRLPGNDWVLFTLRPAGTSVWDAAQIVVQSLVTDERDVVFEGGRDARYVETGHLVYGLAGVVLAVPFDLTVRRVTGGPVPLIEGVSMASDANTGAAQFAPAMNGTLAFIPGSAGGNTGRSLLWVTADGQDETLAAPARDYTALSLSPDGTRAALEIGGEGDDVWVSELARGTLSRITTDPGFDGSPFWSPDGERVIFTSTRSGQPELFSKAADGTGAAQLLVTFDETVTAVWPYAWSPDGTTLAVQLRTADTALDVGVVSLDGDGTVEMVLQTPATERGPAISPDGRWLAYSSNETGVNEVYVQRFPELGDKRQLSVVGTNSHSPRWSDDGGLSLIYLQGGPPTDVMRVAAEPVVTADGIETRDFGPPEHLLNYAYYARPGGHAYYAISPNDQRLLMIGGFGQAASSNQITIVLNWFEELKARVPTP